MDLSRLLRSKRDLIHHEIIADEYEKVVNEPRAIANKALFRSVRKFLPHSRKRMLDIGCGNGQMSERFGRYFDSVIAVDHSPAMLRAAKVKFQNLPELSGRISFIESDAFNYATSAEQTFDFICAVGFLHHLSVSDQEEMLKLLYARLTPGGRIVLAEPLECDPLEEPSLARWWNAPFRKSFTGYSKDAVDPDEGPIPLWSLLNALKVADLKLIYSRRGWELFPRFRGSLLDRFVIPIIDIFTRKNGVVGLFVASK